MNIIYNAAVSLMSGFVKLYSKGLSKRSHRKFSRFVKGQQGLMAKICREMAVVDRSIPTFWFHCASLGEYGVARPLIAEVKRRGRCNVVLTFFSPTGYEALKDNHPNIDYIFYLPLDTRRKSKAFINAVQPDRAVFIISEYWPNYLTQLKFNAIPTFLVSAIIRDNSQFFKWYGKIYRKALSAFSHIFVLNNNSRFNLSMLGYDNVTVCGDALFDNASLVARMPWTDDVIEHFAAYGPLFIAGSLSDYNDYDIMGQLIKQNPDTRFVIVPHEIDESDIRRSREIAGEGVLCHSECDSRTDMSAVRVLIVDCMGKLAYLYRYGTWAYVGGGFTPFLHSVIEATVYGLPVAFGPCIERKVTPQQLVELGIGCVVNNGDELCRWFASLKDNPNAIEDIKKKAASYVLKNEGATDTVVSMITKGLWGSN